MAPPDHHWFFLSLTRLACSLACQAGVFLEPGVASESVLNEGDAGYAPRGSGHYFINTNTTHDAYVILMFDDGEFTNMDVTALTANVPPQVSVAREPVRVVCQMYMRMSGARGCAR